jgi:hypothetical protein
MLGVSVIVGVWVIVEVDVIVGVAVFVSVGDEVGVCVGVTVGEPNWVAVLVGVAVGRTPATLQPPPQLAVLENTARPHPAPTQKAVHSLAPLVQSTQKPPPQPVPSQAQHIAAAGSATSGRRAPAASPDASSQARRLAYIVRAAARAKWCFIAPPLISEALSR